MPHFFPSALTQRSSQTCAMMGSISHSSECRMRPALEAAAEPEATDAGISFGPWHAPAKKTPSVGLSIGRSLGWYSVNHPPGPCWMFSTELTESTSGCGTAAWLSMTISYSYSVTNPSVISSEWTNRLWVLSSSVIRLGLPWMNLIPIFRARS